MSDLDQYLNKITCGDALSLMKELPDGSVDSVVTSPPYYGLRDYGHEGQLGLEPTFTLYLQHLLTIFKEVKRVLKKTGTCWVNIGDTYSGSGNGSWNAPIESRGKQYRKTCNIDQEYLAPPCEDKTLPPKCLIGIPERFKIAMTDEEGWLARNTIVWHKPNCMPASVTDRFTVDFEYLYFFTKSPKYYFEQQFEPLMPATINRAKYGHSGKKAIDGIHGGLNHKNINNYLKKGAINVVFGLSQQKDFLTHILRPFQKH